MEDGCDALGKRGWHTEGGREECGAGWTGLTDSWSMENTDVKLQTSGVAPAPRRQRRAPLRPCCVDDGEGKLAGWSSGLQQKCKNFGGACFAPQNGAMVHGPTTRRGVNPARWSGRRESAAAAAGREGGGGSASRQVEIQVSEGSSMIERNLTNSRETRLHASSTSSGNNLTESTLLSPSAMKLSNRNRPKTKRARRSIIR